jgi:hypothetical protein
VENWTETLAAAGLKRSSADVFLELAMGGDREDMKREEPMSWFFAPYVGISDIQLSSARHEVEALLGTPRKTKRTYTGKTRIEYGSSMPAFVFADETLIEINMLPELSGGLLFAGLDLFGAEEDEVVRLLEAQDDTAHNRNGVLIFSRLGIALSGFAPPAADQKAITVFGPDHAWSDTARSIPG